MRGGEADDGPELIGGIGPTTGESAFRSSAVSAAGRMIGRFQFLHQIDGLTGGAVTGWILAEGVGVAIPRHSRRDHHADPAGEDGAGHVSGVGVSLALQVVQWCVAADRCHMSERTIGRGERDDGLDGGEIIGGSGSPIALDAAIGQLSRLQIVQRLANRLAVIDCRCRWRGLDRSVKCVQSKQ